ncbi:TPA: type 1 fimbrial protein [Escherichia coli]|nr:type 1 fimbrial protein [Escherichia coli]
MFKGQKTLTALAISLLFTAPVYAADEGSGEIHFKGEVIEAPCEIHQDDIDKEVELGQVTTSHINQSHHSDAVAVDLRLVNCDLENSSNGSGGKISKVAVTFDSSAKTTGADPILNNTSTGEATGVGVRLMNKDQSNIVLGTATPDIDLAPTSSEQTLNFFAWMEQIDQATPVTPGQLQRMRPTCWIINKYYFGGAIAAFLQIFIRYGHREYLSTLFCILPGHGDALRIGGRI